MAAHQAPLSLGFSKQEHWSGLPFPSPMHESEKWKWSCTVVSDSATPWTAAYQALPSTGFSRQEYWSGVPVGCNLDPWRSSPLVPTALTSPLNVLWHLVSNSLMKWSESCSVVSKSLRPHNYTVHGTLQARILEWVDFPFSRGSSQPRDQTQVSHIAGGFFTSWATREAQI